MNTVLLETAGVQILSIRPFVPVSARWVTLILAAVCILTVSLMEFDSPRVTPTERFWLFMITYGFAICLAVTIMLPATGLEVKARIDNADAVMAVYEEYKITEVSEDGVFTLRSR